VTAIFKDLVTSSTFTTNFTVNLTNILGDTTAFMGFTGADGGVISTQIISGFVLAPPNVRLTAQHVGDSLILTWPASVGAFLKATPTVPNTAWSDVTAQFRVVTNQNQLQSQVTVTPISSGANQFYRLWVYP